MNTYTSNETQEKSQCFNVSPWQTKSEIHASSHEASVLIIRFNAW